MLELLAKTGDYADFDCVSQRDEPWAEAKETLTKAWNDGYRAVIVDDSVDFVRDPEHQISDEYQDHSNHGIVVEYPKTLEDALALARCWWSTDDVM